MDEPDSGDLHQADDPWACDPQVRAMRSIFAALEKAQAGFLDQLGLDPWDPRLRAWRSRARRRFRAVWPRVLERGLARDPEGAAGLYLRCLARSLESDGAAPPDAAPLDEELDNLLREMLP